MSLNAHLTPFQSDLKQLITNILLYFSSLKDTLTSILPWDKNKKRAGNPAHFS